MGRLSRAQTQERNRATVLAAARAEFAERGFRDAKIDVIAERAELTRGAVYSNFPSKRALYFAVLADEADEVLHGPPGGTVRDALGSLARAWTTRPAHHHSLAEIVADDAIRRPFTQLMKLDALLLALAMERLRPLETAPDGPLPRLVRTAEVVLTTLHGAGLLASAAPGFVEPFDVISACERLAGLDLNDYWAPPHAGPRPESIREPWSPPPAVIDMVSAEPARFAGDGVVAVLGLHRVAAVEDAVRSGTDVVAVLVSSDPGELIPLARLTIAEVAACLRQAFPRSAWPRVQVICDDTGAIAAAAGVPAVSDETETAVRIEAGRIVARAEGRGAGHAAAAMRLTTGSDIV
ncbi:MAG TPA: TetR/AcrR family transcriptional regulator [Pseudonocardiaceae bacterium]|jgi:AcrR family transcriptional regulator|nr:TetR/AcrR family transcriptional regulator [Pseudonocardiaceae bacterium]